MGTLTTAQKLAELHFFYPMQDISKMLNTHAQILEQGVDMFEPALHARIAALFEAHCWERSEKIPVEQLSTLSPDHPLLVDTPDGFQQILTFWNKKSRPIHKLTSDTYQIRCSNDHLIETPDGWRFAQSLIEGDRVIVKGGIQRIKTNEVQPAELVYDFEVGHDNHRYWCNGFSSHNTGKSFIAGNVIREAQQSGAFNLILDSENALDEEYLTKIGVNYDETILRKRVVKITDAWSLIRAFLDGYISEYGDDLQSAPRVHITIDSLGFLMTDSDYDNAMNGEYKADQGASKKMIKDLLKKITHSVAGMNITYLCTDQVYQARSEQIMAGTAINGAVLNEQVKFAFHQIAYLSRLKLKDAKTSEITGIRLKIAAAKTRFTKPFGQIELEVPYETGIDPFNGLLEVAVALGVVEKRGARYCIAGQERTWFAKDFGDVADEVLALCVAVGSDASINVDTGLEQDIPPAPEPFGKQKNLANQLLQDME